MIDIPCYRISFEYAGKEYKRYIWSYGRDKIITSIPNGAKDISIVPSNEGLEIQQLSCIHNDGI